jgi:peptide/nickel transport system permease protein
VWRRLAANRLVLIGTVITIVIVTLGILAPWISPHDYAKQDLLNSLEPPLSKGHLLGTDQLGRDTLSRILHGIRLSIFVGFVITAISLFFGGLLGLAAGYYRG